MARICLAVVCLLLLGTSGDGRAASGGNILSYVMDVEIVGRAGVVILDTRDGEACAKRSLPGARCLPARDVLGPRNELPLFANVLWLLGTVGVDGSESVLVVGEDPVDRDFVAGLLYLAGQARIAVATVPVSRMLASAGARTEPGLARDITRRAVYRARPREEAIVFSGELKAAMAKEPAPLLVDGGTDPHAWATGLESGRRIVVVGRDARDGIASLTKAIGDFGLDAAVFPGGRSALSALDVPSSDGRTWPAAGRPSPFSARSGIVLGAFLVALGIGAAFVAVGLRRRKV